MTTERPTVATFSSMAKDANGHGLDPKITPEITARVCDGAKIGMSWDGAARYANIHPRTLSRWLQKGSEPNADPIYADFVATVRQARGEGEYTAMKRIEQADDWRADKARLAMMYPNDYSERRLVEGRLQVQAVPWIDPSKLAPDELEALRELVAKAQPDQQELPRQATPPLELEPGEAA